MLLTFITLYLNSGLKPTINFTWNNIKILKKEKIGGYKDNPKKPIVYKLSNITNSVKSLIQIYIEVNHACGFCIGEIVWRNHRHVLKCSP